MSQVLACDDFSYEAWYDEPMPTHRQSLLAICASSWGKLTNNAKRTVIVLLVLLAVYILWGLS